MEVEVEIVVDFVWVDGGLEALVVVVLVVVVVVDVLVLGEEMEIF